MYNRRDLSCLKEGETGIVSGLVAKKEMRRRLLDLGVINGTRVRCVQKKHHGDMAAYEIRGAIIALRRENAREVILIM